MVCHLHKIRAKVGNFRELVKICDKKSEKQLFLGYEKQTVRIVLKNFRFYAINTLYCIK
jgi:hypothetical protein